MTGETDLSTLLSSLNAELAEDVYVFATVVGNIPQDLTPQMIFHEAEGITLIVPRREAVAHGLPFEFPCRKITLNVHSALDAVGFLARITTALAQHKMGVNPVSGFYHDHLFVPEDRANDAMNILAQLSETMPGQ